MANIEVDTSDFESKSVGLLDQVASKTKQAVHDVATEVLRLSQFEVPHDTGLLQNSGMIEDEDDYSVVGYNKVYAAYQHEGARADGSHPINHWQNGRKGKYLEDPIRQNLDVFINYFKNLLG